MWQEKQLIYKYFQSQNGMEISDGIEIIGTSLFIKKEKILLINDIHIGYEGVLHHKGILVPRYQLKEIIKILADIINQVHPEKIIINGDLKHEFGRVLKEEWKEVLQFLDFCLKRVQEVVIIQGNHDPIIKPIAEKRNVQVLREYVFEDTIITHGDELVETKANRVIIGHEHPAITIREGSKWEKYKCFLKGKWNRKELIVVPSFNPLLEGTDILKEKVLSPFLNNITKYEVFVVNKGEVFYFGKVENI